MASLLRETINLSEQIKDGRRRTRTKVNEEEKGICEEKMGK